jgi:glycosyltransferase involved in cell wall biosynthesis
MWFWTSFAEKALKEEDYETYKHCKTLHGAIKSEDFFPINKQERLQLRHRFNIKDDEKILIYLGRNQTRKVGFWANIEALAKFKKYHPNKKIKLLYHCHFSEPGGWPIDRLRDENGLSKEDILCTYFCQKCNEWNIQQFEGEGLDCSYCKTQKSRITAGVSSTINEKDLNKIYNIADASVSYSNSAGLEYTNVESLLAGLPLSTVPYSGTSEFTNEEFVHSVNGTFTREAGTSFKKFVPDINSIVKFFEYIYDLPENKRKDITERGRKWAIEQFDAKNVVKKYEEFLDSCKPIDWDEYHKKRSEIKNINAQIEHKDNNDEFITECYSKILGMSPSKEDDGRKYWLNFLSQPGDQNQLRNSMINSMREAGIQHNNKNAPKLLLEDILDKNDKERCLLILKESLGDCIILTSLLPEIKKKYPLASIYIATDPKFFEVFDLNENVHKCIPWSAELENEMLVTGFANQKGLFNYFHNVGLTSQRSLNYLSAKYD